jgi:hypothetical protein
MITRQQLGNTLWGMAEILDDQRKVVQSGLMLRDPANMLSCINCCMHGSRIIPRHFGSDCVQ